jgi:hypothetical protein
MIRVIALASIAAISVHASGSTNLAITSEDQAIRIAMPALTAKFGKTFVAKYQPYSGQLRLGVWYVSSSLALSPGQRGGGRPEAEIRASDRKTLKLYLSR